MYKNYIYDLLLTWTFQYCLLVVLVGGHSPPTEDSSRMSSRWSCRKGSWSGEPSDVWCGLSIWAEVDCICAPFNGMLCEKINNYTINETNAKRACNKKNTNRANTIKYITEKIQREQILQKYITQKRQLLLFNLVKFYMYIGPWQSSFKVIIRQMQD